MNNYRTPPHNNEAEKSIIGGIFLDNSVYSEIAAAVEASDFFNEHNRAIFTTMAELSKAGDPVDLVSVTGALRSSGQFEAIGGAGYLAELVDYVPTSANIKHYCRLVKQAASARKIIESARALALQAYESSNPEGLAHHVANLQKAAEVVDDSSALMTMDEQAEAFKQWVATKDESRFTTGLPEVDAIIKGVAPGEVLYIVGYSGLFKSAILQNMLLHSGAKTGRHNLFFSLEMPVARCFLRTCQISLEHYSYNVESGFYNRSNYADQALAELRELGADKLVVCEKPGLTMDQIEHYSRMGLTRFGEVGAVGIDYLGLMRAQGLTKEYDRISHNAEQSKDLAKRLNVPVVILTQVDRESAKEGVVEKWSGKGSGAIEASADYMLGLERNKTGDMFLKVLKNRNGEEGAVFEVDIDKPYLKFRSATPVGHNSVKQTARGLDRSSRDKKRGAPAGMPFDPAN